MKFEHACQLSSSSGEEYGEVWMAQDVNLVVARVWDRAKVSVPGGSLWVRVQENPDASQARQTEGVA